MGFKTKRSLIVCLLLCLLFKPIDVGATSLEEFYEFYDVDYTDAYPNDIINTIRNYQEAQRYIKRYRGVIESEFDTTLYESRLLSLKKELDETSKMLLAGYDLSLYEIYSLEDKYNELSDNIANLEKAMCVSDNSIEVLDKDKVPTYSEYCKALEEKAKIDSSDAIGDIDKLEPPIASSKLLDKHSSTSTTYMTTQGAVIKSLFSGKVTEVGDDYCVISNDYKMVMYYRNLSSIDVKVGQSLNAGAIIGKSYKYVTLQLSLNNKFVDLTKLFEKE